MTKYQRQIMAQLARDAQTEGLEHDLEAAQALARDGLAVETIEGMMRGMFSRPQIRAMLAEAKTERS